MSARPPFDFDVSVSADKRRRARPRSLSGAVDPGGRGCEWPGCGGAGAYRAPHSPAELGRFRWFCLDHVRAYNAAWNFFDGYSEAELDAQARADRVWERPTWSLGQGPRIPLHAHPHAEGQAWARFGFRDPHEVLGNAATLNPGERAQVRSRLTRPEQVAVATLGLDAAAPSRAEARARYRSLVKELHPDLNGGANPEPERLTRVLRAWDILKKSPNLRD